MTRPVASLALLLGPVLVLAGWIGWLALERAGQPQHRIAIQGYDPRDLLRGHYLEFRLDLTGPVPEGPVCLDVEGTGAADPQPPDPLRPTARPLEPGCALPVAEPGRIWRYYLDQDQALALETLLRDPAAETTAGTAAETTVTVIVHPDGAGGLGFSGIRVEPAP